MLICIDKPSVASKRDRRVSAWLTSAVRSGGTDDSRSSSGKQSGFTVQDHLSRDSREFVDIQSDQLIGE